MKPRAPLHAVFILGLGLMLDTGSQGIAAAEDSGQSPCSKQIQQAGTVRQGRELQGRQLQGPEVQGRQLQGPEVQGRQLQGPEVQGRQLQGPEVQGRQLQGPEVQGRQLQGPEVQGRQLQGPEVQGPEVQGRQLQGPEVQGRNLAVSLVKQISIKGSPVEDLKIEGTLLTGTLGGKRIAGADFADAVVTQRNPDGSTFDATIQKVEADPRDQSCEVFLYTLIVKDPTTGKEESMCGLDPLGGKYAMPVYGSWDTTGAHQKSKTEFMFACTSGVIAKCIRWGYRPWKSDKMADYHQTCTRMARADYCGDGVSHTEEGTLIDMYDSLGIQRQSPYDPDSPMLFDAAWTPNGAFCVAKERWLKLYELPTAFKCKAKFVIPAEGILQTLKLLKTAKTLSMDLLAPLERSPIDSQDVCVVKREGWSNSEVLIDNRSGFNIKKRRTP